MAPDPVTAEILRRHAAGEKLTSHEYGKLGAYRSRLSPKWHAAQAATQAKKARAAVSVAGSPQPAASPGPASLDPMAPGQAPGDRLAPPPVDPERVRRTTAAVLKTVDGMAQRYVSVEAKKAGADAETTRETVAAVALQDGPRELMVETSPEVLASLGVNMNNYPLMAFGSGLAAWGSGVLMAVLNLWEQQTERRRQAALERAKAAVNLGQPMSNPPAPGGSPVLS